MSEHKSILKAEMPFVEMIPEPQPAELETPATSLDILPNSIQEIDKNSRGFDAIYNAPEITRPNRHCQVTCAIIEFEQKEKRRLSTINDEIAFPPPAENDWDDLDRFKEAPNHFVPSQLTGTATGKFASSRSPENSVSRVGSQKAPTAAKKSSNGTAHGFCANCSNLDLDQVLKMKPAFWGSLVLNLGPTGGDWITSTCQFCNLLAAMRPHLTILGEEMEPVALYAFRQSRYLWPISSQGVILAVLPTRDRRVDAQQSAANTIETASFLGPINAAKSIQNGGKMKVRLIEPTKIDYSLFKKWIQTCKVQHGSACNVRPSSFDIKRVYIDCTTRKIVSGKGGKYAALSYVWGSVLAAGDFNLDSSLPENIPLTFEDAITVTKNLGYQYLWIDRYCLRSDLKGETIPDSGYMDLIYQRAEVVIIATFGKDPTAGLPGVSTVPRIYQPHATIGNYALASTMRRPRDLIMTSAWATRGWTYQEALLAQRRLVFTEEQVYYECWTMNRREAVDLQIYATEINLFSPKPGLRSPGAGGRAILQTIAAYTARKLTYESDILKAFEGVLRAYMQAEPAIRSYWGIPVLPSTYEVPGDPAYTLTQGFLSGLCWHTSSPGTRRPGFPSWSWAGWTGTVSAESREYIVGVKQAFRGEIAVSVIYNGNGLPWEEMWTGTNAYETLGTDRPATIYVYAWTVELMLLHTAWFKPAEGDCEAGFYAYPVGVSPARAARLVRLSQASGADKELAGGKPEGKFVGVLLGRGHKGAQEMFVLVVRRVGDAFERLGSVHFSTVGDTIGKAANEGWFSHKKRKVMELV